MPMNYPAKTNRYQEAYNHCLAAFDRGESVWGHNPYEDDPAGRAGWNAALKVVNRRVRDVLEFYGTDRRR